MSRSQMASGQRLVHRYSINTRALNAEDRPVPGSKEDRLRAHGIRESGLPGVALFLKTKEAYPPPHPAPSHKISQPKIHYHPAQAGVDSEVKSSPIMPLLIYPLNKTFTEHLLRPGPCDACRNTTCRTDSENGSVAPGDTPVP